MLFYTILTESLLLFLLRFLQQPTEGTTAYGSGDGEGTELGERTGEHFLKTNGIFKNPIPGTNLQFGLDFLH